ncbi:proline-serine-threonine phosphatase-interacting protein 2 isoform X1 [Tachysurus ichikawai]
MELREGVEALLCSMWHISKHPFAFLSVLLMCIENGELTSTAGYDAILQHLNDGKRTCKEIEDFMKARAAIEEKYAKELLGLSKKVCGHNEMNTLKRSLDVFKLQTEQVSMSHLHLAQAMRDEAKKLEEFREKQKDARKKVEQQMDVLHKQKGIQYKKTMEVKVSLCLFTGQGGAVALVYQIRKC